MIERAKGSTARCSCSDGIRGEKAQPSVVLAGEHYNMIARMLRRGLPVKLRVNVQAHYRRPTIPTATTSSPRFRGTDPQIKDEVVLDRRAPRLVAHGHRRDRQRRRRRRGARSDADPVKALGARPSRTIRVALWGGEEQGLLGSKAYAAQHLAGDANKAARDKIVRLPEHGSRHRSNLRLVMQDSRNRRRRSSTRGSRRSGTSASRRNVIERIGNTDHLSFPRSACPASTRSRTTSTTTCACITPTWIPYERVREKDMAQSAVVLASFAWHAAMRDEMIPRPPAAAK